MIKGFPGRMGCMSLSGAYPGPLWLPALRMSGKRIL
jgi:hypothetical protein